MSSTAKDHKSIRGAYTERQSVMQKQDHHRRKTTTSLPRYLKPQKSHGSRAGRAICPGRNLGRLLERDGAEWPRDSYRPVGELETCAERDEHEHEHEQTEEEAYDERTLDIIPEDTSEQEQDSFEFQVQLARALSLSLATDPTDAPGPSTDNFNSEPEISEIHLIADGDEEDGEVDAYSIMGTDLESELDGSEWVDVDVADAADSENGKCIDRPTYAQMIKVEIG